MYNVKMLKRPLPYFMVSIFISWTVKADLVPVVQETGRIFLSVDAEGNNNPQGGQIAVEKPVNGVVRRAYLLASSHSVNGNRVINDGDVSLAGVPISWQRRVFNGISNAPEFFHNVFAEVTTVVKPILDAAPAGINQLRVTEVGTNDINGTILAVIFDDPNQLTENSVIFFFGGQDTSGDTFVINFSQPINNPAIQAEMGMGIAHSFQGNFGTPMLNIIDVNGTRLTSSAGGEDDGESADGALITVGGIGDRSINPPPLAPPSNFRTDDELYDLSPFIRAGDNAIELRSFNPTDDDNIFFAYFFTSVPSATLPDIPAPGDRMIVGSINPALPTVVLTHGLQDMDTDPATLWSGDRNIQAGNLIQRELVGEVNIVQYIWDEAFQDFDCAFVLPSRGAYIAAQRNVADAGVRLASELLRALGSSYDKPIHFIGHSLGTAVNAHAARAFLDRVQVRSAQFTALDRPHHVTKICGMSNEDERRFGFDEDFFSSVLPISRPGLNLRIDNYFAAGIAGVGDVATGPVYNHPILDDPGRIDSQVIDESGVGNNHSGVHQWYRWSIRPTNPFPDGPSVCDGSEFAPGRQPNGFDDSLNPCEKGWHWSINNSFSDFPSNNGAEFAGQETSPIAFDETREFGCEVDTNLAVTRITCEEQSSPFVVAEVNIPTNASAISFEYRFTDIGDGDYAAILLDDEALWTMAGESVLAERDWVDSGAIPIGHLNGDHRLTVALFGVGASNSRFQVRNLQYLTIASNCVTDSENLCLNQRRFKIEVDWRDFNGNTGSGQVVPFGSDDSGLFWFFNADNWEMLVKVLDGCSITNRFWVFAAATTNVEYTLRVTDTLAGVTTTYFNPLGLASPAITDTDALATCDVNPLRAGAEYPPAAMRILPPSRELLFDRVDSDFARDGQRIEEKQSCTDGTTNMCLNRERFNVEVRWRDFQGNTGPGRVVPFGSDDSGLLWFFSSDNWEMLVKVLNGCGINNRYWVFSAATTNVGYTLTVTDTATGVIRQFRNPLGLAADAITDTGAFATCP